MSETLGGAGNPVTSLTGGIQWGLDRMVAIAYGVVYDAIFERFAPYRVLRDQVVGLVRAAAPPSVEPRDVRVLEIGCGPGNFSTALAEAGFTVTGLESYGSLLEVAKEKRRARGLPNLSFRHGDLARGNAFRDGAFDQVVSVHALYAHPEPDFILREAWRVLRPGGQAVFVNRARRLGLGSTFRETRHREGLGAALGCLGWVVPNAIFEAMRRPAGPHYWAEDGFVAHVRAAGFTVRGMRRTFLSDASIMLWAAKENDGGE